MTLEPFIGIMLIIFDQRIIISKNKTSNFTPARAQLLTGYLILSPESEMMDNPIYDKMKYEALKEKYDLDSKDE